MVRRIKEVRERLTLEVEGVGRFLGLLRFFMAQVVEINL